MINKSTKKEADSEASTSSQWLRLNKDPRIVRVSRAFGGKDRHSKVCTIRGLRDRRVRLSVPTAIHLYDLQDRLGLSQPSKVVDWLLSAAKHEIDELPPLPVPPGRFALSNNYPSPPFGLGITNPNNNNDDVSNAIWRSKSKEVSGEMGNNAHVLLPIRANHVPSFIGLLNAVPFGNYQWEPPPSSSAGLGSYGIANYQTDHTHHNIDNVAPFPSALSLSTSAGGGGGGASSQILMCPPPPPPPPPGAAQSFLPSSHVAAAMENADPRQINSQYHHQVLISSSNDAHQNLSVINSVNPFGFAARMVAATPKLLHSPNNSSENHSNEDRKFPSQ